MTGCKPGTPVTIAGWTLVPIEAVLSSCHTSRRGLSVTAWKEPVAVVLMSESEVCAFDLSGNGLDPDRLAPHVRGLAELLRGAGSQPAPGS